MVGPQPSLQPGPAAPSWSPQRGASTDVWGCRPVRPRPQLRRGRRVPAAVNPALGRPSEPVPHPGPAWARPGPRPWRRGRAGRRAGTPRAGPPPGDLRGVGRSPGHTFSALSAVESVWGLTPCTRDPGVRGNRRSLASAPHGTCACGRAFRACATSPLSMPPPRQWAARWSKAVQDTKVPAACPVAESGSQCSLAPGRGGPPLRARPPPVRLGCRGQQPRDRSLGCGHSGRRPRSAAQGHRARPGAGSPTVTWPARPGPRGEPGGFDGTAPPPARARPDGGCSPAASARVLPSLCRPCAGVSPSAPAAGARPPGWSRASVPCASAPWQRRRLPL